MPDQLGVELQHQLVAAELRIATLIGALKEIEVATLANGRYCNICNSLNNIARTVLRDNVTNEGDILHIEYDYLRAEVATVAERTGYDAAEIQQDRSTNPYEPNTGLWE